MPSGRRYGSTPTRRTWDRRWARRWASHTGRGMRSGVSSQAYPNIIPWSPAPWALSWSSPPEPVRSSKAESTPWAMSGDCPSRATMTPQVRPLNPKASLS